MGQRTAALETLLSRLSPRFKDRISTDPEALARASHDESGYPAGAASAVVWPGATDEVALVLKEAQELGVAIVPRGAGTGKAGASIPKNGEVVIDLSRMNRLLELRPQDMYARVEPGLITRDLDLAAGERGFMYPPDPASWESCSIGGNINTNAGGPRAVKYGVTQRYVWGLTVVLMGGEVLTPGKRSIKGVAGYDITSLLVGSEGTLGVVTEATLHIIPKPRVVETGWITFKDPMEASRASEHIFAAGITPRMLELLDQEAMNAVRKKSAFQIPEGVGASLLIETDGNDEGAMRELLRACEVAVEHGARTTAVAQNERDREGMRRARRLVSGSLKEIFPFKISDDIAVPRSRMPELLTRSQDAAVGTGVVVCAYGHLGDGNVHINLLCKSSEERGEAQALREKIMRAAVAMGGTITGEHGIGIAKRDHLTFEQSSELLALQRRVKMAFDPAGLLNPGKAIA